MAKSKAAGSKSTPNTKNAARKPSPTGTVPSRTAADVIAEYRGVKFNPWFCIIAFIVPFVLTLIAYIGFDVYPFGKRSVLTLDLNGQYIYYFEAIRDAFWGDGSPFYNWSRNLSGGFMGVIGYYLASPFTFIVILMPRKMILEAVMLMQMCKVGACGLTFCIYAQRSKHLKPAPSLLFSTMYAMMSYVVIQLINPMWIDGPIFLPLIILGVEYLIDDGRKLNYIIPLAIMFVANFYIGFMVAIFVAIYFVYYLFFGNIKKYNTAKDYVMTTAIMGVSTFVVLMLSAFMIIPVYNALKLGKFDFSEPVYDWKKHLFKWAELIPTLLPNQYYSVNVDEGTRMYGRPEIYCGVLTLVLLPLFFANKKIKWNRKVGSGMLVAVMLFSMYIKPINMLWHGGQDPNWLPYRYSFILSFILVAMAAEIFSHIDGYKLSLGSTLGTFAGIAFCALAFNSSKELYNYNEERYKYPAFKPYKAEMNYGADTWQEIWLGTILFGILLAALYLFALYFYSRTKNKQAKTLILTGMAALVFFEGGYNCYDSFRKIYKEVGNSDKKSYTEITSEKDVVDYLEKMDGGFYRAEKTYTRMVNDNIGIGLKGISHSSSVMNARAIDLITALGYFTQSYESKYDEGNNPIADSLMGIKYILDDPERAISTRKVLDSSYILRDSTTYERGKDGAQYDIDDTEKHTVNIYENPNALTIGYAANEQVLALGTLGSDNSFNSLNQYLSAMTGNLDVATFIPKNYYVPCETVMNFNPEQINCHEYPNGDRIHACYESYSTSTDAHINLRTTAQKDGDIYLHINSDMKKEANVWVATKGEDGVYRGTNKQDGYDEYSQYFKTNSAITMRLGPFKKGTEIEVRLTIPPTGPNNSYVGGGEYLMAMEKEIAPVIDERTGETIKDANGNEILYPIGDIQLYYLDEEAFAEDINKLKTHQWDIDMSKSNDRYLTGDVTIGEGEIFVTSIPYEPGWTIEVDGKKIKNHVVEEVRDGKKLLLNQVDSNNNIQEGEVIVIGSLIGVKLPAGEHTISMKYTPPGFNLGMFTLVLGIAVLVMFYMYDRKHNPIIVDKIKSKERRRLGLPEEETAAPNKKKVQIIKSKGAVTGEVSDSAKEKQEKLREETEKINEQNEKLLNKGKAYEEEAENLNSDTAEKSEQKTEAKPENKPAQKPAQKKNSGKKKGGKKKKK